MTLSQLPKHTHPAYGSNNSGVTVPVNNVPAAGNSDVFVPYLTPVTGAPNAVSAEGGGQAHNNLQPYLCVSFMIALEGIFPSRG